MYEQYEHLLAYTHQRAEFQNIWSKHQTQTELNGEILLRIIDRDFNSPILI